MKTDPPARMPAPQKSPAPPKAPPESMTTLTLRQGRRIVVTVIGGTLMLMGVAMLVLPGPGVVVIAGGLAVLATEFVWARRWLKKIRQSSADVANAVLGTGGNKKAP